LKREIGWFSSFAMSFSIIASPLACLPPTVPDCRRPPGVHLDLPLVGLGQLLLAVVFAKLARRIPSLEWLPVDAGTRRRFVGMVAGWLMIIQVLTGLAPSVMRWRATLAMARVAATIATL